MKLKQIIKNQKKWLKSTNLKIGSKVKIIEIYESYNCSTGEPVRWNMAMDITLGKTGVINKIEKDCIEISFEFSRSFYYLYSSLRSTTNLKDKLKLLKKLK